MRRLLTDLIAKDLGQKMVFLSGPRQAGKTTLAMQIAEQSQRFPGAQVLNWDVAQDRAMILSQTWPASAGLVVFDELHKMKGWKLWLKGVFDGRPPTQTYMVTGSARLDAFRQTGESLAGRYFSWRLHPVSLEEWLSVEDGEPEAGLQRLLERGGFPEPLLAKSVDDAQRWRRLYLEGLVREDILEFSRIQEVRAMRLFVDVLRSRVGSPVSLASIARDLQLAPATLAKYLEILEALYIVFTVRPFHRNIARALLKEPKVYFYDLALVDERLGEGGARFENACAAMLLQRVHHLQDAQGKAVQLQYVRDKEGREIDFVVTENDEPILFAEAKLSAVAVPNLLASVAERFPNSKAQLVVRHLRHKEQRGRVSVELAAEWLSSLSKTF
ncbi:MAG: ATP-binding protein [Burkholderiaceae bacterium]